MEKREIRFRVYSPEEKKMSKPFGFDCDVLSFTDDNGLGRIRSPKPGDIFMQYSTAQDDNGDFLCESDIVKYVHEDGIVIAEVVHQTATEEGLWISGLALRVLRVEEYMDDNAANFEIIGNIYETPELLTP